MAAARRITLADTVIDALVAALRGTTGFRAPSDTDDGSGITVFDGPEVLNREDSIDTFVVIGYGGELTLDAGDVSDDLGQGDVSVRAIATTSPKEEQSSFDCLAVYQTGDTDVAAARRAVIEAASEVDAVLRDDPKIGLAVRADGGQLMWTQVTGWSLRTYFNSGIVAELRFTLTFYART